MGTRVGERLGIRVDHVQQISWDGHWSPQYLRLLIRMKLLRSSCVSSLKPGFTVVRQRPVVASRSPATHDILSHSCSTWDNLQRHGARQWYMGLAPSTNAQLSHVCGHAAAPLENRQSPARFSLSQLRNSPWLSLRTIASDASLQTHSHGAPLAARVGPQVGEPVPEYQLAPGSFSYMTPVLEDSEVQPVAGHQ